MKMTLAALLLGPTPLLASTLEITVRDAKGAPLRDAVVTVASAAGKAKGPPRFAWPSRVSQRDIRFDPYVLIVPVGADVAFPNFDRVRHHVYSFSPAKKFELKLYGRDESRRVKFERAGTVALGCNIHDSMTAFIKVVDTPFAAKTDANGVATITGLPAGGARVTVWHPFARLRANEMQLAVTMPGSGKLAQSARLPVTMGAGR